MKSAFALPLLIAAFCYTTVAGVSSADTPRQEPELCYPAALQWQPGPASLPPGAQYAKLEGDPAKEGPFTMRIKLPDGFRIPPHTHPAFERVTVISGIFNLGVGEKFNDAATQPMTAGTFGFWPPGMKHFAWAKGETVLQLHGTGPWRIEYVSPADDPRNASRK